MSLFKISPKTIALGGLAIAAAAGALRNRDKVAGLIGARSSAPEPPRPEAAPPAPPRTGDPAAPAPANYDLAGPAANTATHVPAPEVYVRDEDGGIDEAAEEAAAAAEAAAIGGGVPEYPGLAFDEEADEATRPLIEAGEGESEGEELAEYDLVDEAESRSGDTSDAERQIEEIIEQADNPTLGESIEVVDANIDAATEDDKLNATTSDDADDGPKSTAKDDDDPSNDGVRDSEQTALRSSDSSVSSGFGFAGGKVGGEPEADAGSDPAPGLPNAAAADAVAEAAGDDGPQIHPDQTSLLGDEGPKETPAAEKSSAVWQPPSSPSSESAEPGKSGESSEEPGDDDGGSEWQTWSGRAAKPE